MTCKNANDLVTDSSQFLYPSMLEARHDFFGLPSCPLSIYHTGPAWPLPRPPEGYRIPKEARPVCTHAIAAVWCELGERIYKHLDSIGLKWTSIDPVRFAEAKKEPGPLFLWIGALPGTLSPDAAMAAATGCKKILGDYEITDVEIAFRESVFTWFATTQFLGHVTATHPTVEVRRPFTAALGLNVSPKAFPSLHGTSCLYLCDGDNSDKILVLMARHTALPLIEFPNNPYCREDDGPPDHEIMLLGTSAFQDALQGIRDEMETAKFLTEEHTEDLESCGEVDEDEDAAAKSKRERCRLQLMSSNWSKTTLDEFYAHIIKEWSADSERTLGRVVYAPPIAVATDGKRWIEDWALVELDPKKVDRRTFQGNAIDIGPSPKRIAFLEKMYPELGFRNYPHLGLLLLKDFVPDDELSTPTTVDEYGEDCLVVVKDGAGTGLTVGRMSGIESFVREYHGDTISSTSMQMAVYSYSHSYSPSDAAFSAPGDSGSVVGDVRNRIVGMLVGGAGRLEDADVTYLTPYSFLDKRIKKAFPNVHLFPTGE